jgi:hypothetical protein
MMPSLPAVFSKPNGLTWFLAPLLAAPLLGPENTGGRLPFSRLTDPQFLAKPRPLLLRFPRASPGSSCRSPFALPGSAYPA